MLRQKRAVPVRELSMVLALAAGCLFGGCARTGITQSGSTGPALHAAGNSADGAPATRPAAGAQRITIDNFTFDPPLLTVPAGTTVTWVNHDDVPHTATGTAREFDSGALDTDGAFSFTFARPGTYSYYCAVHPHMSGRVVVR